MHRETWVGDVEWSEGQILAGLEYRVIHGIQVDRGTNNVVKKARVLLTLKDRGT